jgi:hypothetical protein
VERRIGAFLEWSGRVGASPVLDAVVAGLHGSRAA